MEDIGPVWQSLSEPVLSGFGAFMNGHWCASKWHSSWLQQDKLHNLVLIELFPVIVSLVVWKDHFQNCRVMVHMNNKSVFFASNTLWSKSEPVIKLQGFLVLHCMLFNIWLKVKDIAEIRDNRPASIDLFFRSVRSSKNLRDLTLLWIPYALFLLMHY